MNVWVLAFLLFVATATGGCLGSPDPVRQVRVTDRYLMSSEASTLEIVIRATVGYEPAALTLDGLRDQALVATGRADVQVVSGPAVQASPGGDNEWGSAEFAALWAELFPSQRAEVAVMVVGFVPGRIENLSHVGGIGTGSVAVVFQSEVDYFVPPPVSIEQPSDRRLYERAAAVHEVGHLLGLVNNHVPRLHGPLAKDRIHSGDPDSVMYPVLTGGTFLGLGVGEDTVDYRFTQDDIDDIRDFQRAWVTDS